MEKNLREALATASNGDLLHIIESAIENLAETCYDDARLRGFHKDEVIGSLTKDQINEAAAKLHGEVSEFWEAARKCLEDKTPDSKVPGLNIIEEEVADIIIGAFELACSYGLNVGKVVFAKANYNSKRGYLNGKGV